MSGRPRVTVLMPVRDGARFLDAAVASVLSQNVQDLELVAIDDASSDATPELLRRWRDRDPRLAILTMKEHVGLSAALNRGLEIARSALVARQDCDDLSLPYRLAIQAAALEREPGAVLVGGNYEVVDAQGRFVYRQSFVEPPEVVHHLLNFANVVGGHSLVMFRRDAVISAGGYDERFAVAQDWELWTRLRELGPIRMLRQVGMRHRLHENRLTVLQRERASAEAREICARCISAALGPNVSDDEVDAAHRLWNADGRPFDTQTALEITAAAGASLPADARRRVAQLTAAQLIEAGTRLARAGHLASAGDCVTRAVRRSPTGAVIGWAGIGARALRRVEHRGRLLMPAMVEQW